MPCPCEDVLSKGKLRYRNSGFMHTDWGHHVDVDQEPERKGYNKPIVPLYSDSSRSYTARATPGDDEWDEVWDDE